MLVAGSIWPEDLPALAPLLRKHARTMRFIVAPHEVSEAHLQEIEAAMPGLTLRYSRAVPGTVAEARLLLIDNVGMLSQLYRFGQFAYIGGAFGRGCTTRWKRRPLGCPCISGRATPGFRKPWSWCSLAARFRCNRPGSWRRRLTGSITMRKRG
ncbi:hypothetical protein [Hymenobacter sp. BRD67]|uniref:hypothetical protein n=1 Tax=Hymenobacter sp. BRD67 TaxID=2675877 RepID=UPI001C2597D3|nr:hypothetical protein [Hymenobacter sp. BRD67]